MSFERINLALKQISASTTYTAVQSLIEQHLAERSLSLTAVEQAKLIRLCLRKLNEWFSHTPDQIKEIKLHFHQLLIRTPTHLTQKQLIDLLLDQLQITFNDYLIFLLTDVYDKNYSKLLEELEREGDVAYLVHLPDRVSNVCRTHIPTCFQARMYFHRLSGHIEEQLLTHHYPKMLAQTDTNVNFLCQLVHRAAKLGELLSSHDHEPNPIHRLLQDTPRTSGVHCTRICSSRKAPSIPSGYASPNISFWRPSMMFSSTRLNTATLKLSIVSSAIAFSITQPCKPTSPTLFSFANNRPSNSSRAFSSTSACQRIATSNVSRKPSSVSSNSGRRRVSFDSLPMSNTYTSASAFASACRSISPLASIRTRINCCSACSMASVCIWNRRSITFGGADNFSERFSSNGSNGFRTPARCSSTLTIKLIRKSRC